MKKAINYFSTVLLILFGFQALAQENEARDLDNFRYRDQRGIEQFEAKKDTATSFDGVKVRIGGAFAIQFQAIDHESTGTPVNSDGDPVSLIEIGSNFNLPTANLDLDVQLYDGVSMHLRTYLSSRHHPEPYVKGGYIQIDKLDFVSEGFMEDLMQNVRIKIGHMENNYGDAHFRRTDNALAIYNPFVGNLIMDAFTTEVGAEVYYFKSGFIGMLGVTNGKLNQGVDNPKKTDPSIVAKLGYDDYINDDLRLRLTGSVYHTNKSANAYLYSADRAGSRYYFVMEEEGASAKGNFTSGRFNPGLRNELTAFMINPFVKYQGLEFFGTYEMAKGKADAELETRTFNQYAAELIYRFGNNENLYVGGRYNLVDGEMAGGTEVDITRFNLAAGWFMTKNIMAKLEYTNQKYDGFLASDIRNGGKFDGVVFEAVISF
ncbi:hypothetical protein K8089_14020 [Aequorivita sp. F47161]|uniref:Phosphate-selective porin O and P n=1 Tax=Aequorivita vitellina TaxID=2874475 RepID=A0A9X1QWD3_9FLAO|nr:hypothetical protein [Aequorivita vitellina]MCG2420143.1 hypothetical protein [Aequorivita vitellina]MCZ4319082.1 hypothetical protein [Aequorivita viscosa]